MKKIIILFNQEYSKLKTNVDSSKTPNEIKKVIYKERLSVLKKVRS